MNNLTPENQDIVLTRINGLSNGGTLADGATTAPCGNNTNDCVPTSKVQQAQANLAESLPQSAARDYVSAPDALKRIRAEMPGIFQRAASKIVTGELPLIGWGLSLPRVQDVAADHEGRPWFFVGDIHGDFLAWHRLFERVRQEKDFRLCVLGDLVDRGLFNLECFAALLEAVEVFP
ncbi:MAG: metallophosphoesterase, partial [bacterium]